MCVSAKICVFYGHQVYCRFVIVIVVVKACVAILCHVCDGVGHQDLMRAAYAVAWLANIGSPVDWCYHIHVQLKIFCSINIYLHIVFFSHALTATIYGFISKQLSNIYWIQLAMIWYDTVLFVTIWSIYLWRRHLFALYVFILDTLVDLCLDLCTHICDLMVWWQYVYIWELESLFSTSTLLAACTTKCTYKINLNTNVFCSGCNIFIPDYCTYPHCCIWSRH